MARGLMQIVRIFVFVMVVILFWDCFFHKKSEHLRTPAISYGRCNLFMIK